MPILEAKGEAEALCAQLDKDGHVDACITADSDSFLFGANCVIKCIHPNSRVCLSYSFWKNLFFLWVSVINTNKSVHSAS